MSIVELLIETLGGEVELHPCVTRTAAWIILERSRARVDVRRLTITEGGRVAHAELRTASGWEETVP